MFIAALFKNSQEIEATQMFTDGRTNKQNVVNKSNGILFSLKKGGNSNTCHTMEYSHTHKKTYNYTYMRYVK